MKIDITKSRFKLLKKDSDNVKEIAAVSFSYADVNCLLMVKFPDVNQEKIFSSTFAELCDIVDSEI